MDGVPPLVATNYREWRWSVAWRRDDGEVTTWRLDHGGAPTRFLKVGHLDDVPSLFDERDRLVWAGPRLPVPEVLDCGRIGDVTYLVTLGLPGVDAAKPGPKTRPAKTARALGEGLRRLHETPAHDCPFQVSIDRLAAVALENLRAGRLGLPRDPANHRARLSRQVAERILADPPSSDEAVLCHGDYCAPNALLQGAEVTGFVDLGLLGVADRWRDIAVGSWSAAWNFGDKCEAAFLDGYGIEPDPARLRFFRVVFDLYC